MVVTYIAFFNFDLSVFVNRIEGAIFIGWQQRNSVKMPFLSASNHSSVNGRYSSARKLELPRLSYGSPEIGIQTLERGLERSSLCYKRHKFNKTEGPAYLTPTTITISSSTGDASSFKESRKKDYLSAAWPVRANRLSPQSPYLRSQASTRSTASPRTESTFVGTWNTLLSHKKDETCSPVPLAISAVPRSPWRVSTRVVDHTAGPTDTVKWRHFQVHDTGGLVVNALCHSLDNRSQTLGTAFQTVPCNQRCVTLRNRVPLARAKGYYAARAANTSRKLQKCNRKAPSFFISNNSRNGFVNTVVRSGVRYLASILHRSSRDNAPITTRGFTQSHSSHPFSTCESESSVIVPADDSDASTFSNSGSVTGGQEVERGKGSYGPSGTKASALAPYCYFGEALWPDTRHGWGALTDNVRMICQGEWKNNRSIGSYLIYHDLFMELGRRDFVHNSRAIITEDSVGCIFPIYEDDTDERNCARSYPFYLFNHNDVLWSCSPYTDGTSGAQLARYRTAHSELDFLEVYLCDKPRAVVPKRCTNPAWSLCQYKKRAQETKSFATRDDNAARLLMTAYAKPPDICCQSLPLSKAQTLNSSVIPVPVVPTESCSRQDHRCRSGDILEERCCEYSLSDNQTVLKTEQRSFTPYNVSFLPRDSFLCGPIRQHPNNALNVHAARAVTQSLFDFAARDSFNDKASPTRDMCSSTKHVHMARTDLRENAKLSCYTHRRILEKSTSMCNSSHRCDRSWDFCRIRNENNQITTLVNGNKNTGCLEEPGTAKHNEVLQIRGLNARNTTELPVDSRIMPPYGVALSHGRRRSGYFCRDIPSKTATVDHNQLYGNVVRRRRGASVPPNLVSVTARSGGGMVERELHDAFLASRRHSQEAPAVCKKMFVISERRKRIDRLAINTPVWLKASSCERWTCAQLELFFLFIGLPEEACVVRHGKLKGSAIENMDDHFLRTFFGLEREPKRRRFILAALLSVWSLKSTEAITTPLQKNTLRTKDDGELQEVCRLRLTRYLGGGGYADVYACAAYTNPVAFTSVACKVFHDSVADRLRLRKHIFWRRDRGRKQKLSVLYHYCNGRTSVSNTTGSRSSCSSTGSPDGRLMVPFTDPVRCSGSYVEETHFSAGNDESRPPLQNWATCAAGRGKPSRESRCVSGLAEAADGNVYTISNLRKCKIRLSSVNNSCWFPDSVQASQGSKRFASFSADGLKEDNDLSSWDRLSRFVHSVIPLGSFRQSSFRETRSTSLRNICSLSQPPKIFNSMTNASVYSSSPALPSSSNFQLSTKPVCKDSTRWKPFTVSCCSTRNTMPSLSSCDGERIFISPYYKPQIRVPRRNSCISFRSATAPRLPESSLCSLFNRSKLCLGAATDSLAFQSDTPTRHNMRLDGDGTCISHTCLVNPISSNQNIVYGGFPYKQLSIAQRQCPGDRGYGDVNKARRLLATDNRTDFREKHSVIHRNDEPSPANRVTYRELYTPEVPCRSSTSESGKQPLRSHSKDLASRFYNSVSSCSYTTIKYCSYEASVLERVQGHPFIIRTFGTVNLKYGASGLLLELCGGGTLERLVLCPSGSSLRRQKRWTPPTRRRLLSIFAQVAEAMDHVHRCHVLHRDLKLSNILLDRHGNVRISDFGVATYFDDTTSPSLLAVYGNIYYAAPEVLRGEGFYPQSDVWSFAISLWESLHGVLVFDGLQAGVVYGRVACGDVSLPMPSDAPNQLKELLLTMLDTDWRKRPCFNEIASKLRQLEISTYGLVTSHVEQFFLGDSLVWQH